MARFKSAVKRSFAYVYDALYDDPEFLQAQAAFLAPVFGPPPKCLLDLGCGTGAHLRALAELGHTVVGIDVDPEILSSAQCNGAGARLVRADVQSVPFCRTFDGALCLESPLAYVLDAAGLLAALLSIRNALNEGARLVIDVYDYPGTLGIRAIGPREAHLERGAMRVKVVEAHRYEKTSRIWTMKQAFEVLEPDEVTTFEVVHRLRMRTMDEYAQALEGAGFTIEQALTTYPNAPEALRHERRLILVARR